MCGLVGLAGANRKSEIESVLPLISHRGPDGQGVYADEDVTLGHCRLAIIDPAAGTQPFIDPSGRYVLVYNGELYNFRELGARLERLGHRLSTHCDTEVLAYWLAHFGESGLADLNGMFAFAFWDAKERTLLLARDRIGIKPLYFASHGCALIFGSEIKAMLPFLPRCDADAEAIYEFVTFQQTVSDRTVFRGISRLSPGRWLKWTPANLREGTYWDLSIAPTFRGTHAEAVERYRLLLDAAVQRQMISDVPLGSHLSSGLDSSAVATLAARHSSSRLATFTGAFTDGDYYDERTGTRIVAAQISADAHEIEITAHDLERHFADVVWHLEEPTLGTGALPQYMVAGLAARHVKVVLTGHGGDELFAGYQVNKAALVRNALHRGPLSLLSALQSIRRDEFTRVLYFLFGPLLFPDVGYGLFVMTPERQRSATLHPDFLAAVRRHDPRRALESRIPDSVKDHSERLMHVYLKVYLPTLFIQEDKVGMAHSIEARVPICDNELIDFACSLSLEQKLHAGNLKSIPRDACRSLLPDKILTMPKRGFPTPFARWFRDGRLSRFIVDRLLSRRARERNIFNPSEIDKWVGQLRNAKLDTLLDYARANRLYSAAVVEQWHRTFIDGDRTPGHPNLPRPGAYAQSL